MKSIQLIKFQKLIETPDFNKFPILEKLVLEDCLNLPRVHPSIGVHKKLICLCIKGCRNLKRLPTKLEMESLETLILSRCSKIKKIPEFGENMQHVLKLYLDEIAITKLPTSIGHLTGLAVLNIRDCKSRDGNFAPPRLTRPSPLRPVRVFPAPQRWWGGDGVRF